MTEVHITTTTELTEYMAAIPDKPTPEQAQRLMAGAIFVLRDAIECALDASDLTGGNMPDLLSAALREVAEDLGDEYELIRQRPGSWEATHVEALGRFFR